MFNGLVPYKDLFEQKGPVVYFVIGLVSLPFDNSLFGVFILEIVSLSFYQYYCYKIIRRYTSEKLAIISSVAVAILTATTWSFNQGGGAVEEYFLAFFAYGIYKFLEYFEDKKLLNFKEAFIIGLISGVIFWSKFLSVLFFVFIAVLWLYDMIFVRKKIKKVFYIILGVCCGFLITTIPVLLYFYFNDALNYLFECYFYNNIFRYNGYYEPAGFSNNLNVFVTSTAFFASNIIANFIIIFGLVFFVKEYKSVDKRFCVYLAIFYFIQIIEMWLSWYYSYYQLQLLSFLPLFIIPIAKLLENFLTNLKIKKALKTSLLSIFAVFFCFIAGNNTLEFFNQDKYPQIKVSKEICLNGGENPTLLCYKMMDYGFYREANILPTTRYFALNNFGKESYPEMYEELEGYLEDGVTEYVLVFFDVYTEEAYRFSLYEIIDSYEYEYFNNNYSRETLSFTLLKLKV